MAPLLTEIYLNAVGRALLSHVNALPSATLLVIRYVDDILVCSVDELEIIRARK